MAGPIDPYDAPGLFEKRKGINPKKASNPLGKLTPPDNIEEDCPVPANIVTLDVHLDLHDHDSEITTMLMLDRVMERQGGSGPGGAIIPINVDEEARIAYWFHQKYGHLSE